MPSTAERTTYRRLRGSLHRRTRIWVRSLWHVNARIHFLNVDILMADNINSIPLLINRKCLYLERGLTLYSIVEAVTQPDVREEDCTELFELTMRECPHSDFNDLELGQREARSLTVGHSTWIYGDGEITSTGYVTFTFVYGHALLDKIAADYKQISNPDRMSLYRTARRALGWGHHYKTTGNEQ
jgi:hypothetical protein